MANERPGAGLPEDFPRASADCLVRRVIKQNIIISCGKNVYESMLFCVYISSLYVKIYQVALIIHHLTGLAD